jgi:hypothetical protein
MDKWGVEHDQSLYMDIAIEDDSSQTWLAAKRFIWVSDLPESLTDIIKLAREIGEAK